MKFLHSKNIIHCDLKLSNVFIRVLKRNSKSVQSVQLLLADFDIATVCANNNQNNKVFNNIDFLYNKNKMFNINNKIKIIFIIIKCVVNSQH